MSSLLLLAASSALVSAIADAEPEPVPMAMSPANVVGAIAVRQPEPDYDSDDSDDEFDDDDDDYSVPTAMSPANVVGAIAVRQPEPDYDSDDSDDEFDDEFDDDSDSDDEGDVDSIPPFDELPTAECGFPPLVPPAGVTTASQPPEFVELLEEGGFEPILITLFGRGFQHFVCANSTPTCAGDDVVFIGATAQLFESFDDGESLIGNHHFILGAPIFYWETSDTEFDFFHGTLGLGVPNPIEPEINADELFLVALDGSTDRVMTRTDTVRGLKPDEITANGFVDIPYHATYVVHETTAVAK